MITSDTCKLKKLQSKIVLGGFLEITFFEVITDT